MLQVWGWVQEMYAFAMAMYAAGLHDIDLIPHLIAQVWGNTWGGGGERDGHKLGRRAWPTTPRDGVHLIPQPDPPPAPPPPHVQPPWDADYELQPGRPFYILHYTYGLDFNQTTGEWMSRVQLGGRGGRREREEKGKGKGKCNCSLHRLAFVWRAGAAVRVYTAGV